MKHRMSTAVDISVLGYLYISSVKYDKPTYFKSYPYFKSLSLICSSFIQWFLMFTIHVLYSNILWSYISITTPMWNTPFSITTRHTVSNAELF